MTERKRALTDLRPTAEQTLFADWRVTPALRERLHKRIDEAAVAAPPQAARVRRPWLRWGGGAAVAAAAVLAMVIFVQPPGVEKEESKPAEAPATAYGDGRGAAAAYTSAEKRQTGSAPPVTAQVQLTAMDADLTVNGTSTFYDSITVAVLDENGNSLPQVTGVESQPGRKIVQNAEYQLQVTDAVSALQRLQNLAATTAGYVVDAALDKGTDGSWAGRLILRLPAGQYNGAIAEIRRIGEVRQERQWSQDVTERYYDLEARIRIQQEYERKLEELAAKATTFDDWMKLTQQINNTRATIEQMQGSLKLLANQVEYSTISISFNQPAPGQEPPPKPPEPAKGLWPAMTRAFHGSIQWFADLGQALLVRAAAFVPFLLAISVLGLLALAGWRRWRKEA